MKIRPVALLTAPFRLAIMIVAWYIWTWLALALVIGDGGLPIRIRLRDFVKNCAKWVWDPKLLTSSLLPERSMD